MPQRQSPDELTSQAEALKPWAPLVVNRAKGIGELLESAGKVVFGGCGSGHGAAFTATTTFQAKTSISSRAAPATEICQSPEGILIPRRQAAAALLSRACPSTEVAHALDQLHSLGIEVLAVTCMTSSALATSGEMTIVLTRREGMRWPGRTLSPAGFWLLS